MMHRRQFFSRGSVALVAAASAASVVLNSASLSAEPLRYPGHQAYNRILERHAQRKLREAAAASIRDRQEIQHLRTGTSALLALVTHLRTLRAEQTNSITDSIQNEAVDLTASFSANRVVRSFYSSHSQLDSDALAPYLKVDRYLASESLKSLKKFGYWWHWDQIHARLDSIARQRQFEQFGGLVLSTGEKRSSESPSDQILAGALLIAAAMFVGEGYALQRSELIRTLRGSVFASLHDEDVPITTAVALRVIGAK